MSGLSTSTFATLTHGIDVYIFQSSFKAIVFLGLRQAFILLYISYLR